MIKELQIIALLRDFLLSCKLLGSNQNINELFLFFKNFKNMGGGANFNQLYILNFLKSFICDEAVAKKKASARDFEELFAVLFDGQICDEKTRKNDPEAVPELFINVKDKIAKNRREKADVTFPHYALSIKTLIPQNKEINLGSFERSVLFDGFGLEGFLTERKNPSGVGLGSPAQFLNLLKILQNTKKLDLFYQRFLAMASYIFSDCLLIAIKQPRQMDLYFYEPGELFSLFKKYATGLELPRLFYRYEGNSIRLNREPFLAAASRHAVLDFSPLDHSIIALINDFDLALHRNFAAYFNGQPEAKNAALTALARLFDDFEKRLIHA